MQIQPYLFFERRCNETLAFYQQAVGANVLMLMRFKEAPDKGMTTRKPGFTGMSLSLSAADEAEAGRLFDALADDGTVLMPLAKTFFASCFGMLADRFGVTWMVTTGG